MLQTRHANIQRGVDVSSEGKIEIEGIGEKQ
jgi:hypothetical protein